MAPKKRGRDESGEQQSGVAKEKKEVVRATITDAVVDAVNTSVEAAFQELEDERKSAEAERAQLLAEARATAATTTETAEDEDEEITRKVKDERARLLAEAAETAAKVKEDATAEAEEITRKAREGLAAFEAEKAAMEQAHTFQNNKILLNVGGHKFETSRQTLTSVPDTYLASMFSGRFELAPDGAERSYFIDRDGTHFRHILNFLRDSGSFKLNSGLTEAQREELKVELEFYGLLDRVMPYCAQELIGQSLLKRACLAGTKLALQPAVAVNRALVFEMGSATPFLNEKRQSSRWGVIDRVVNGLPVWATEDGVDFMFRDTDNQMIIGSGSKCAEGENEGDMYNTEKISAGVVPTELRSDKWVSASSATLAPQFASAERLRHGSDWDKVPKVRITAVHGLDDDDPAMAAALRQLAALK